MTRHEARSASSKGVDGILLRLRFDESPLCHQSGKQAIGRHQLPEGTALDDAAAVKHQDQVGIGNGGETVGDDEGRAALAYAIHRALDSRFGFDVQRTGRFIEDQDRCVLEDCPGDGDALALAARKRSTALTDDKTIAAGLSGNEIVCFRQSRCLLDLQVGRLGPADANVVAD